MYNYPRKFSVITIISELMRPLYASTITEVMAKNCLTQDLRAVGEFSSRVYFMHSVPNLGSIW